jgi:GNAT superfamily N-acetyltransferase
MIAQTMPDPGDFTCAETLRNGLAVTIRGMHPDDRDKVAAAIGKLDQESVYSRLFSNRRELTAAGLDRVMTVDPGHDVALLVTRGSGAEEIVIGSGRYVAAGEPDAERTAEVAFVVDESHRGLGIAGRLLHHLAEIARRRGIVAFEADVLAGNRAMLGVFSHSGLAMRQRRDGDVVHITLSLQPNQP